MSDTFADSTFAVPAQNLTFSYVPRPGLVKITLINLLLSILTLTIYRFWGKTNVRKHIWSCIHINGEPLEYTGTGMELFKGFLFVFGFFIFPFIVIQQIVKFAFGEGHYMNHVLEIVSLLFVYAFYGYAIYKARKYQLTRTLWRGIRGNLVGSASTYSATYFGAILAKIVSLGWAAPAMSIVLHDQITNEMRFGDAAFKFKGRAKPLYLPYAFAWLVMAAIAVLAFVYSRQFTNLVWPFIQKEHPTDGWYYYILLAVYGLMFYFLAYYILLPFLWSYYTAKEMRLLAEFTRFDGARFKLDAKAGSIIWLTLGNLLILIFTLSFGWPFVQQRTFRFVACRLQLEGAVDIDRIQQSQAAIPKRGEGLADAFDVSAW